MKLKEFNLLDFLFYKFYRIAVGVKGPSPIFSAVAYITLIIELTTFWLLVSIIRKYALNITLEKWHVIILLGICLLVVSLYFYSGKRYQRIIDQYKTLGKTTEIITDILTIVGFIVFIVVVAIGLKKR